MGDHKNHVENYDPAPEGMFGGSCCGCDGTCSTPSLEQLLGLPPNALDRLRKKVEKS
jgi:hypothetical protein